MENNLLNLMKEKLSAFGQDNFSNVLSLVCINKKLCNVRKRCSRRLNLAYPTQLLKTLTLNEKIKIKSELVRFNYRG